jgi:hypothetical protein
VNVEQLKKFIEDSRYCSETEKCAVACATDDLERAPWCDDMGAAFACLDEDQRATVNAYRKVAGLAQLYALVQGG